ncbi:hypothetical protein APHAL10511_003714 [Amanita phalloides]|nr:hypothetical protein APHAL10511_003714 [Amanita phalloides]
MKVYTEKATQTEFSAIQSIVPDQTISAQENTDNLVLGTLQSSAYTYSDMLASDAFLRRNPSVPPRQRYAQLPFNRPIDFLKSSAKRSVSLPEDYAECPRPEEFHRVVSMPEPLNPSTPCAADNMSSFDTSIISIDSDDHCFAHSSVLPNHSHHHSDLPCTPSPPSSPESILIIGNNAQVPRTLLRSKCTYNQGYGDSYGWVTWANSPPRPIPALHGPLSLPYARCPSGAEGTIVEGEDLSNMIWGLNVDDGQSRGHGRAASHVNQTLPRRLQKSPHLSCLPDHGPIDLSQLAVSRQQCEEDTTQVAQTPIPSQCNGPTHGRLSYAKVGRLRPNEVAFVQTQVRNRGLGLHWQDAIELSPPRQVIPSQCEHSTLKPSAPPFVPSGSPAPHLVPRVLVEPRFSDLARNVRWPMVLDQTMKGTPYLATPPDSSSPLWSPYIATPSTLSPQVAYELTGDKQIIISQALSPSFRIKDCARDANEWDEWIAEQSATSARCAFNENTASPAISTVGLISSGGAIEDASVIRNLNEASLKIVSKSSALSTNRILQQSNSQSTSPERRFRGISQQPRSIPLARLIQRRLSSVAEEDVNTFTEECCSGRVVSEGSNQTEVAPQDSHAPNIGSSSPDTIYLEPQTCKQPNHEGMMAVANETTSSNHEFKATVKLPAQRSNTINEEKENDESQDQFPTEPTGVAMRKKVRNRKRSRSSSSLSK